MVQLVAYRKNNTENSGAWRSGTQSMDALMGVDTKDTSFLFHIHTHQGALIAREALCNLLDRYDPSCGS